MSHPNPVWYIGHKHLGSFTYQRLNEALHLHVQISLAPLSRIAHLDSAWRHRSTCVPLLEPSMSHTDGHRYVAFREFTASCIQIPQECPALFDDSFSTRLAPIISTD